MYKRLLNIILSVMLLIIITVAIKLLTGNVTKTTATERVVTIVIDPGHGGNDPGKVGGDGVLEKDLNLSIAQKLRDCIQQYGINVVLTRETDDGLYSDDDSNKKAVDMKNRCKIINDSESTVAISIHQNSFTDSDVRGAQVFFYKHSEKGKILAQNIQKALAEIPDTYNDREIKANDKYYMLLNTTCPTVIVECGFLSNAEETKLLCDETYQTQIAEAVTSGILDFLENND